MNRTTPAVFSCLLAGLVPLAAQEAPKKPTPPPQVDPLDAVVAQIRAAEQAAKSFRIELATKGSLPSGLQFTTSGSIDVLRGTQQKQRTSVRCSFGNGLDSTLETAQTADGIVTYEDNPAFGEAYLRFPPALVADLQWAGEVLQRADLPGMRDRRADAPLGSAVLDGLRLHYAFVVTDRRERAGEAGQWLVGERRPGLGDQDVDLPLATRVEVFVRGKDHAVLDVLHYRLDEVLQRIEVKKLEVDVEIPDAVFTVDGRGQKLRDVEQYPPMRDLVERVLRQAESKAGDDVVRPSKRPAPGK